MAGLRNLCKAAGGMTINGTKWVWDYAADEPVKQSEMPMGSDRWKASQKARAALLRAKIAQEERT